MKFNIEIYTKVDGTKPFNIFMDSLNVKLQAKVAREIILLGKCGNELREPHTKFLELRIKQSNNITRVLYFFMQDRKIILTHGFVKKSQRTPIKEIERCKKYRNDYITRRRHYDEI